jgi:PhnB protein
MKVDPYLNFDGNCAEAFRFYEQLLGGQIETMMTFGESPMADQSPPEHRDRIMHVSMLVDGQRIMASDAPGGYYQKPQGVYVSLQIERTADARRIYDAFAEGGTVAMPFEPTFWAPGGFGMVTDRFGTPWMINCEDAGS